MYHPAVLLLYISVNTKEAEIMRGKMVVTRSASRSRRHIKKGRNCSYYHDLKTRAHRTERRAVRQALHQGKEVETRRLTERDVD